MSLFPLGAGGACTAYNGGNGYISYTDRQTADIDWGANTQWLSVLPSAPTGQDLRAYCGTYVTSYNATFYICDSGGTKVGSITATLTGTGWFSDLTNTSTLTVATAYCYKLDHSAGKHGDQVSVYNREILFSNSTNNVHLAQQQGVNVTSGTTDLPLFGNMASAPPTYRDATFSLLRAVVSTYTGSAGSVTSRDNGAAGNMSITVTGTGTYTDSTNTDTLTASDTFQTRVSVTSGNLQGMVECSSSSSEVLQALAPWYGIASYIYGGQDFEGAGSVDESRVTTYAREAAYIKGLRAVAGSYTTTSVHSSRVNGSAGNLSVTVNGSGVFTDSTNYDSLSTDDYVTLTRSNTTDNHSADAVWDTVGPVTPGAFKDKKLRQRMGSPSLSRSISGQLR